MGNVLVRFYNPDSGACVKILGPYPTFSTPNKFHPAARNTENRALDSPPKPRRGRGEQHNGIRDATREAGPPGCVRAGVRQSHVHVHHVHAGPAGASEGVLQRASISRTERPRCAGPSTVASSPPPACPSPPVTPSTPGPACVTLSSSASANSSPSTSSPPSRDKGRRRRWPSRTFRPSCDRARGGPAGHQSVVPDRRAHV
jgi:hypothetical protein